MNLIQLLFPMDLCQMQQVNNLNVNYVIFLSSDLKKRKRYLNLLLISVEVQINWHHVIWGSGNKRLRKVCMPK